MKSKKTVLIFGILLLLVAGVFYQINVSRDQKKKFIYSSDLHLYPKRSFTSEDHFEVIAPGSSIQILRLKSEAGETDAYLQIGEKKGWVTSSKDSFQIQEEP